MQVWKNTHITSPFGKYLTGTVLLQLPFRTDFSMGSLLRHYCRSLQHFHLSLIPALLLPIPAAIGECRNPCRLLHNSLNIVKLLKLGVAHMILFKLNAHILNLKTFVKLSAAPAVPHKTHFTTIVSCNTACYDF